jgi:quercetin dioxygenase-like cupin family protein
MTTDHVSINLIDAAGETRPDSIISRTIYNGERLRAVLFTFAAGQELSEHTAAHPAVIQIVQGEARLIVGRQTIEGRPGQWVHMAAHLPHSVLALTPVVLLLLLEKN